MSMKIVPREDDSDFLGPIPIHIGPQSTEDFVKKKKSIADCCSKWDDKIICCLFLFFVCFVLSQIYVTDNLHLAREKELSRESH